MTLDKLYIALDTTTTVPLTAAEKAARKKANPQRTSRDEDERIVTALEATQQTRRLVLLGHPGGGKSTFVRQLLAQAAGVWLAAETKAEQAQPGPFPLLTVLRDLTPRLQALPLADLTPSQQQKALCDALLAQWHVDLHNFGGDEHQDTLAQALLTGELLLVFDGLDEMPATVRPLVRAALVALTKAYPKLAQLIVTCRIRSYHGEAVLPGFQAYTLADFDEAKIQAFVAGWYQAQLQLGRLKPEEAKTQRADLQRAARQRDLRRMAVNPLLLTTMALIHQKQKRLPDQRVELYDEAVDVLLYRWQQERANPNSAELTAFLKSNKVRPLLERLAYAAHQPPKQAPPRRGTRQQPSDESTDLTRSELLALLDDALQGQMGLAAEFLDYVDLRAGLLVGRGGDEDGSRPALYAFAHRTFQEYLAGCWLLAGRERKHNFWAHAAEGDYWQLAAQLGSEELLYNRREEQGLLDLMYYLCPVRAPRNKQDRRAALWSGQMAVLLERPTIAADSFADGGTAYLDRLRKRLVAILTSNQLPALERAEAGRVLAKLGDPRPQVTTIDQMEFCFVPAGPFLMGSKKGNGPGEDPLAFENEEPQHTFDIAHDYWLARYPLTNAQYDLFVQEGGYANPTYWTEAATHGYWQDGCFQDRSQPDQYREPFDLPNHPVVGISWYEALAYSRWLTEQLPTGWQARLPSEAEWEKGARGGLEVPQSAVVLPLHKVLTKAGRRAEAERVPSGREAGVGAASASTSSASANLIENPNPARRYAWGDQIEAEKLNYNETNIGSTSAVGAFPGGVSPYGAEEMNGNVLEWCSTKSGADYAEYAQQVDNSLHENSRRVLRGGSFGDFDYHARAAFRFRLNPDFRNNLMGVRFLLSPSLL